MTFQLFCSTKKEHIIEKFINFGFLEILLDLIQKNETDGCFLLIALDTCESCLLYLKQSSNPFLFKIMQSFLAKKLDVLSSSITQKSIKQKILRILSYFKEFENFESFI